MVAHLVAEGTRAQFESAYRDRGLLDIADLAKTYGDRDHRFDEGLVELFRTMLVDDGPVLELGAGGQTSTAIDDLAVPVVAVDWARSGLRNCARSVQADWRWLPFRAACITGAVSTHGVQIEARALQSLVEIRRVMRTGAPFLASGVLPVAMWRPALDTVVADLPHVRLACLSVIDSTESWAQRTRERHRARRRAAVELRFRFPRSAEATIEVADRMLSDGGVISTHRQYQVLLAATRDPV